MRLVVLVLALIVGCGRAPALLHPSDPVTDFYKVSEGIYRGGRPTSDGISQLAKLGVKTIVNLENDDTAIANEQRWAKAAAVDVISIPMSGGFAPSDATVDRVLALLADPARRPVYVHCHKGMDRTGMVIALHRVAYDGWTIDAAERERDAIGFNHALFLLDGYFERRAKQMLSRCASDNRFAGTAGSPAHCPS